MHDSCHTCLVRSCSRCRCRSCTKPPGRARPALQGRGKHGQVPRLPTVPCCWGVKGEAGVAGCGVGADGQQLERGGGLQAGLEGQGRLRACRLAAAAVTARPLGLPLALHVCLMPMARAPPNDWALLGAAAATDLATVRQPGGARPLKLLRLVRCCCYTCWPSSLLLAPSRPPSRPRRPCSCWRWQGLGLRRAGPAAPLLKHRRKAGRRRVDHQGGPGGGPADLP